jgi:hypothetical protein
MNLKFAIILALSLTALTQARPASNSENSAKPLSICEAIYIAENYVKLKNLDVKDHYIVSAKRTLFRGRDTWRVTWVRKPLLLGGELVVVVSHDKSARHFHGS